MFYYTFIWAGRCKTQGDAFCLFVFKTGTNLNQTGREGVQTSKRQQEGISTAGVTETQQRWSTGPHGEGTVGIYIKRDKAAKSPLAHQSRLHDSSGLKMPWRFLLSPSGHLSQSQQRPLPPAPLAPIPTASKKTETQQNPEPVSIRFLLAAITNLLHDFSTKHTAPGACSALR